MPAARPKVIHVACHTGQVNNEVSSKSNLIAAPKSLAWVLLIGGILGWLGAFALTLERLHVAADPNATLSCDIASFISCKSVMLSWQAKLFGFPNPLIGLGAFIAPIVVSMAIFAGARFAKWFWITFSVGIGLGFIFVLWLADAAINDIGALCPYCMVAWFGMIPMFWSTVLFGAREGFIWVPTRSIKFFVNAYDWSWVFTVVTEVVLALIILVKFWPLWVKLFTQ
ncbi:MAG: hypothetical protein RLZZ359_50 [Actinomycetota bacterium]|jgi:uncharacterized membrane protein